MGWTPIASSEKLCAHVKEHDERHVELQVSVIRTGQPIVFEHAETVDLAKEKAERLIQALDPLY